MIIKSIITAPGYSMRNGRAMTLCYNKGVLVQC